MSGFFLQVPPLRVRPADVVDMQEFMLRDISRRRGLGSITLAPEAVRRLEAYAFPDNITELEGMLERAVVQSKNFGDVIPEDVFWFAAQVRSPMMNLEIFCCVRCDSSCLLRSFDPDCCF